MAPTTALPLSISPYPGLRAFRADESDIYFGREEQTDALLQRLQSSRFLAVVGPSGCGKSSLVRAGMIAALETGCMADAGSRWRIAEMRPGDRPLPRLAQALVEHEALGAALANTADRAAFVEAELRRGPRGLIEALRAAPLPPDTNLLLLVDQFEEIFRFRARGDTDEADAFVALLLASFGQRELPIYVVVTMRSDFLGDCALFRGLPEAINDSQYLTPRLTREQTREAIIGPARVCGGNVDSFLVNRLLNDFGPDPDQLPLLQHALMRMWERALARALSAGERTQPPGLARIASTVTVTLRDYLDLGGLKLALSNHADEVLAELTPQQQQIAEVMFRSLTERGVGQRDTRAPARLWEVAAVAGVTLEVVMPVVEAFRRADRSFIMPPVETALTPETLLDIGHESLIRQWRRLGEWVEREARSAALYQRLKQTAQLWRKGEAALWRNPDLERALKWEQEEKPTPDWAARYGTREDFAAAIGFLRASEQEWRVQTKREQEVEQRAREQDIELHTQREREARLQAEVAALRSRKRLLSAVLVLVPALIAGLGWAWYNRNRAVEQMESAKEQAELAQRAAYFARAASQEAAKAASEAERQRSEADAARQKAEQLLERLTNTGRAKQAFLTGDAEAIRRIAAGVAPNPDLRFGARSRELGWRMPDGRPIYRFELFPLPETVASQLQLATQISYFMDHPSFANKLLTAGRKNGFTASYDGWGCLSKVYVLIEYADPNKPPRAAQYDMCAAL